MGQYIKKCIVELHPFEDDYGHHVVKFGVVSLGGLFGFAELGLVLRILHYVDAFDAVDYGVHRVVDTEYLSAGVVERSGKVEEARGLVWTGGRIEEDAHHRHHLRGEGVESRQGDLFPFAAPGGDGETLLAHDFGDRVILGPVEAGVALGEAL